MELRHNAFKKGDKVVPHAKSLGCSFDIDPNWRRNGGKEQGFMYIVGTTPIGGYQLAVYPDAIEGNHYAASDLTLYEESIPEEEIIEPFEPDAFDNIFEKEVTNK